MQVAALGVIGFLALRIVAGKVSVVWLNVCVRPKPSSPYGAGSDFAELEEANLFGGETSVRERAAARSCRRYPRLKVARLGLPRDRPGQRRPRELVWPIRTACPQRDTLSLPAVRALRALGAATRPAWATM